MICQNFFTKKSELNVYKCTEQNSKMAYRNLVTDVIGRIPGANMLANVLIGLLILITFFSLFLSSNKSQKGFYQIGALGMLLGLVLVLILTGII